MSVSASTKSNSIYLGVCAVLFSAMVWGGWLPVTRLGVTTHLEPIDIAILRFFTGGILLLPVIWLRRQDIPWQRWGLLTVVSISAGTPYLTVFAYGMRLTSTGQGAVLGPGATGAFSLLLGTWWLKERLQKKQWLGAAITLTGVVVIVVSEGMGTGAHLWGFGLVLLASISWSTFTISSRALGMDALLGAAWIAVSNAIVLIPIGLWLNRFTELSLIPVPVMILQVGYQGVITGVLALITYGYAIQRLGAARAASFTPLAPVIATILGIVWLRDPVDIVVLAGLVMVVLGVLMANVQLTSIKKIPKGH